MKDDIILIFYHSIDIKIGRLINTKITLFCMESLISALNVLEQLSIELVRSGLKPGSYITFGGFRFPSAYDIEMDGFYVKYTKGKSGIIPLLPETVGKFEDELKSSSLRFQPGADGERLTYLVDSASLNPKIPLQTREYAIGTNRENLDRLLNAQTDYEIGMALGYPEGDVEAYQQVIDGQIRDGTYFPRSLGIAVKLGKEIPLWLAYIFHAPKQLDIVGGYISPATEELGKEYQGFVRGNNLTLADRVEQLFLRRCSPDARDGFIHYVS